MSELQCKVCKEKVIAEDAVQCYLECKGAFHYECAQVKEVQFRKRSPTEKLSWGCSECRQVRKTNQSPGVVTLSDVHAQLMNMNTTLTSMQREMKDIVTSQKYLSDRYDEMEKKLSVLGKIEKELQVVKEEQREKDKIIDELTNRLVHMEQYSRRHHLEFTNIAVRPDEDLEQTVIDIAQCINVKVTKGDIEVVHRLHSNQKKIPVVIAEFNSRKLRDTLLKNRKKVDLTNENLLGKGYGNNKIGIKESLSPYFKKLFWLCKVKCEESNYKWCWYRNNRILVKKTDNSKEVLVITNPAQVSSIK